MDSQKFIIIIIFFFFFFFSESVALNSDCHTGQETLPPVTLQIQNKYAVVANGFFQVSFSIPEGYVAGIQYQGISNLLEVVNSETDRGYWDLVWRDESITTKKGMFDRMDMTKFSVIVQNEDQIELSFTRTWNSSLHGKLVPLNIDKRFVVLRGSSGFYTYAIYDHSNEYPAFDLENTRVAFKLRKDKFHYMAIADNRQRFMPLPDDRLKGRGIVLDYPEAVKLINPIEPEFKGEVDDKYEYACESRKSLVHGWIGNDSAVAVGFWLITPSLEFKSGGPLKQFLTSHVGPTTLSVFHSTHYTGIDIIMHFGANETWKKVYGPVFIYLNSLLDGGEPLSLWDDAKKQVINEVQKWPYNFPATEDFPRSYQRGNVSGRLLVLDWYVSDKNISASRAYVGLASPGDAGSWQIQAKGYQFWTTADEEGYFKIRNVRIGEYYLYGWVPGFIGDYKYETIINISAGSNISIGELVYKPPRNGSTLWEIGIPDRTAAEFYVPDPNPDYVNKLYINHPDRYRQYGLWERYAELYPDGDMNFTIGSSNYSTDWFFAQVTRGISNSTQKIGEKLFKGSTWQIKFNLAQVDQTGIYKLRLALATANAANLEVRINDPNSNCTLLSTGEFGHDNTIARHGIHGLYRLFNVDVTGSQLLLNNTIYLSQINNSSRFQGIMYDYIRFETPSFSNTTINNI